MKDYGTLENKRALFDKILETMTSGNGMSMTRACRANELCPTTFLLWAESDHLQDPTVNERYRRAQKISCLLEADDIVQTVIEKCNNPPKNEFGIDKGFAELEKLRAGTRQWRLNGRTRMFIDKQEDAEEKTKDIGTISVNIIKDSNPQG